MNKTTTSYLLSLGLILTGLSSSHAHSEETSHSQERSILDYSLEDLSEMKIETASKRPQKLLEIPADTIVIHKQQIAERHYRHLGDLLEDLPSIDVFRNHSEEAKTMVSIRGIAGNNKFLILKNGQRLNPPTGEALPVDFNYPLYDAERVEVIYGPASALYGADAFTGIINIVSADPTKDGNSDAAVSYGSYEDRYAHVFLGAKLQDNIQLEIGAHAQNSENPDLSEDYPDQVNLGPLVGFDGSPISGLARNDSYSNETSSYSFDTRLKVGDQFIVGWNHRNYVQKTGNGQLPNTTIYGPESNTNVDVLFAEHKSQVSQTLSSRSNISYLISEIDPDTGYNNVFTNYERAWKYGNNQVATINQEFMLNLNTANHLVVGASGSYTHAQPQTPDLPYRADADRPLEDQGYTYPGTNLPIQFYDINSHSVGLYTQLQTEWNDRFSSTIGGRYDDDSRYGNTFNPRAGIVYKVSDTGTAKLLYGESYRAPPAVTAYSTFGSFSGTDPATGKPLAEFFHIPNSDLQPEKARTLEAYYGHFFDQDTLLSGTLFSTWMDDLINAGSTQGRTEFAGGIIDGIIEQEVNRGNAFLYGGNVSLSMKREVYSVGIEPFINYSYTHGELDDGDVISKTPYLVPQKVKAGVTLRLENYSATMRYRFNSESYLVKDDELGGTATFDIPSYHVFDLALRAADIYDGLSLTLDIRNIFDNTYTSAGGLYSNNYVESPQDSRTWMLQLNYKM